MSESRTVLLAPKLLNLIGVRAEENAPSPSPRKPKSLRH